MGKAGWNWLAIGQGVVSNCNCITSFVYSVNCSIIIIITITVNPCVLLFFSNSLPYPTEEGGEQLHGDKFRAGVKPQHFPILIWTVNGSTIIKW